MLSEVVHFCIGDVDAAFSEGIIVGFFLHVDCSEHLQVYRLSQC